MLNFTKLFSVRLMKWFCAYSLIILWIYMIMIFYSLIKLLPYYSYKIWRYWSPYFFSSPFSWRRQFRTGVLSQFSFSSLFLGGVFHLFLFLHLDPEEYKFIIKAKYTTKHKLIMPEIHFFTFKIIKNLVYKMFWCILFYKNKLLVRIT